MAMCEHCGKHTATVKVTRTVNGQTTEEMLCTACAREAGVLKDPFMTFAQMMAGMAGETVRPQTAQRLTCSHCGYDFSEFKETGLLGCPHCYSEFKEVLDPMIRRIQGSLTHLGDRPGKAEDASPEEDPAEALQKQLTQAIAAEEYEKAAVLRDRIRALKERREHHADAVE